MEREIGLTEVEREIGLTEVCSLCPGEQGEGEREDAGNGSRVNICLGRAETKETS